jgi:hypothetical protein
MKYFLVCWEMSAYQNHLKLALQPTNETYHFKLTAPDIEFVLSSSCNPGFLGFIVQMANAEVLLHNISDFGYFFVAFYFIFSELGCG